jgi:hypothetical protein
MNHISLSEIKESFRFCTLSTIPGHCLFEPIPGYILINPNGIAFALDKLLSDTNNYINKVFSKKLFLTLLACSEG